MILLRSSISARERIRHAVFLICLLSLSANLHADESQHDVLFFTSVDSFNTFDESEPELSDSFVRPSLDVLYSYSTDRFRFLGEYLWSSTESELERLKVGWQAGDNTMLWFGRFHSTSKFWTSEYHHGQFLQNSITRPSVEEWEDESGPVPSHITGFSLEHESTRDRKTAISYAISVGLAPKFDEDELRPYDMLDPESGHGASLNYKMAYRPDLLSENQIGLSIGWNDINVAAETSPALIGLDEIEQLTIGAFVDWRWKDWRFLANAVRFSNDMNYVDGSMTDRFLSGYVQIEYQTSEDWTVFGRSDSSSGEDNSPYLRMLPSYIAHRHMLGVRWDVRDSHSLTLEIADTSAQGEDTDHEHYKELRVQWSAVFP